MTCLTEILEKVLYNFGDNRNVVVWWSEKASLESLFLHFLKSKVDNLLEILLDQEKYEFRIRPNYDGEPISILLFFFVSLDVLGPSWNQWHVVEKRFENN